MNIGITIFFEDIFMCEDTERIVLETKITDMIYHFWIAIANANDLFDIKELIYIMAVKSIFLV